MPAKSGQPVSLAALQVVKASLDERSALVTLAGLAEHDPGFAVRVLALVNSAAFGLGRKITDVRQGAALVAGAAEAASATAPRRAAGQAAWGWCPCSTLRIGAGRPL